MDVYKIANNLISLLIEVCNDAAFINRKNKTDIIMGTGEKVREKETENNEKKECGIIMPISTIDDCLPTHWEKVREIISESITEAGYTPNLVSDADYSGIIQERIVQNLYKDEIVVCDVSARNPNVMFELGMRLAFDKPAIIVIDDKTDFSFDTSIIEHIKYPRGLDYYSIVQFKSNLKSKILATVEKSKDPHYSPFLKRFGEFKVAKVENKEGNINDTIISEVRAVKSQIQTMMRNKSMGIISPQDNDHLLMSIIQEEIFWYCNQHNYSPSNICYDENVKIQIMGVLLQNQRCMSLSANSVYIKHLLEDILYSYCNI